MTVDHRCSLLSCLQVILMSTRWQVGKSLQLPALLLMFMFVPMFIISIGIGELLLHLQSYRQVNSKVGPGFGM